MTTPTPAPTATTEPAAAATAPAPAAPSALAPRAESRVPVSFGVTPSNIDEAWRMAQYLAASELVPKQFRKAPGDVLVAMQLGAELGLAPMQSLQSVAVINGRATVWGDALLAVVVASPLYENHDEYFEVDGKRVGGLTVDDLKKDTTTAVCVFTRHNKPDPVVARFSVGQAKKAGLLGKEGPWQTYPDRMLKMRARGFAARDAFADLLRGIKSAEEVYDTPDDELRPAPVVREVRRVSESRVEAPAAPVADEVVVGPLSVVEATPFLDGFTVRLSDGTLVDTLSSADALDLEKFKGTDHRLRLTCTRADGRLLLKSFAIAD